MKSITELHRFPAPAARPQPLVFDGKSLWTGSWETDHIYELDPNGMKVIRDIPAPGKPYGLALLGKELRVVVALGEDDDRFFYRFDPKSGFDESSKTACPEFTGSHLASDGTSLYLAQMHYRQVLVIDAHGKATRTIPLPSRIGGLGFANGTLYTIEADEEFDHLQFASLDISGEQAKIEAIAPMDEHARSLAFDGSAWWTCYREKNEIVSFTV